MALAALFLIGLALLLAPLCSAPDACTNPPACWTKSLDCSQWERRCNGDMCSQVCADARISPALQFALATQRKLQQHVPYDRVQLLGTHNSYISPANGIGWEEQYVTELYRRAGYAEYHTVIGNQRLTLRNQLEMGVRHLELDIHQLAPTTGRDIRVCHWDVAPPNLVLSVYDAYRRASSQNRTHLDAKRLPRWDFRRLGCFHGSPRFSDVLEEIRAWLSAHPEDFVSLYLDNRVFPAHAEQAMSEMRSIFGKMLFTPKLLREEFGGDRWPSTLELTSRGYQVLFENYDKFGWAAKVPSANETVWNRDAFWGEFHATMFEPYPACKVYGQPIRQQTRRLRALDSSLVFGPSKLFDDRRNGMNAEQVKQMVQCGVAIISLDQAVPSLVEQAVWTWDLPAGEPQPNHNCTALSVRTARWYTKSCDTPMFSVCRLKKDKVAPRMRIQRAHGREEETLASLFVLSTDRVSFASATESCSDGYEFTAPISSGENTQMVDLAKKQLRSVSEEFVWLRWNPHSE